MMMNSLVFASSALLRSSFLGSLGRTVNPLLCSDWTRFYRVNVHTDKRPAPPYIIPLSIRRDSFGVDRPLPVFGSFPIFTKLEFPDSVIAEPRTVEKSEEDEIEIQVFLEGDESAEAEMVEPGINEAHSLESTKRKRKTKMNKHKYRKRLKLSKFLRRKLGQA